jgi:prepilin-type N-terminal cleavage/methylation domain-containing protein
MNTKTQTAFTLVEIMIVVAIIGLLAAMAVPSFKHAIATSAQKVCKVNRQNIDGAKAQWALDHQQSSDAVPTDTDLFGEDTYIEHKPGCPAGGAYSLNAVREKCTCSLPPHSP